MRSAIGAVIVGGGLELLALVQSEKVWDERWLAQEATSESMQEYHQDEFWAAFAKEVSLTVGGAVLVGL